MFFQEKEIIAVHGTCSAFGSCHVDRKVNYFGASCQGLEMGATCTVKTEQFTAVQGECSAGGHCKGLHGQVRFHHETCKVSQVRGDVNKIERVKEFIKKNTLFLFYKNQIILLRLSCS